MRLENKYDERWWSKCSDEEVNSGVKVKTRKDLVRLEEKVRKLELKKVKKVELGIGSGGVRDLIGDRNGGRSLKDGGNLDSYLGNRRIIAIIAQTYL